MTSAIANKNAEVIFVLRYKMLSKEQRNKNSSVTYNYIMFKSILERYIPTIEKRKIYFNYLPLYLTTDLYII